MFAITTPPLSLPLSQLKNPFIISLIPNKLGDENEPPQRGKNMIEKKLLEAETATEKERKKAHLNNELFHLRFQQITDCVPCIWHA